jgi:hypothetical protein
VSDAARREQRARHSRDAGTAQAFHLEEMCYNTSRCGSQGPCLPVSAARQMAAEAPRACVLIIGWLELIKGMDE